MGGGRCQYRLSVVVLLLLMCGMAYGQDTLETRVAVIEQGVQLLRNDVKELKRNTPTRQEWEALNCTVNEIKTLVNPKIAKVDALTTWKDDHTREHDVLQKQHEHSTTITVAWVAVIVGGIQGATELIRRRNGRKKNGDN